MIWFLLVASIVAYWIVFRIWHPFWSTRPGPHIYHMLGRKIGIFDDYIIRNEPAEIPPESRWEVPHKCTRERLSKYATLLNDNYALGTDYIHTYTPEILEQIIFAPNVMAYEVTEEGNCIGMITSMPLKSTKTGQLSNLLKTSLSRTTIGLIDFLCVADYVRGQGLANHLIAWIDVYASQIHRRVHVFEREGHSAPIPWIGKTEYYYTKVSPKPCENRQVEKAIKTILDSSEWDLVNINDVKRWYSDMNSFVYDEEDIGTLIVEDAHMVDSSGNQFGIIIAFLPKTGKEYELFSKITRWTYILAPHTIVAKIPVDWKLSSVAFTHLYNCITNACNLRILSA